MDKILPFSLLSNHKPGSDKYSTSLKVTTNAAAKIQGNRKVYRNKNYKKN